MKKVNLYIESSTTAFQKAERTSGYVLEYIKTDGTPATVEGFRKKRETYHQTTLRILDRALERIHEACELCIYGKDTFVLNVLKGRLKEWAEENFYSNGKPVMNQEEWRLVWEKIKEHKVSVSIGEHAYSGWMLTEMEENNAGINEKQSANQSQGSGQESGSASNGSDL